MEIYIRKGTKKVFVEAKGIGKSKDRIKAAAKAIREVADLLEGEEKKETYLNEVVVHKK